MRDWSLAAACSRQEIVRREVETQVALVSTIMPATDCCPLASWFTPADLPSRGKAAQLANKAEGGKGGQPAKPLGRIRDKGKGSFLRTDDHVGPTSSIFNQRNETSARTQLSWIECSRHVWNRSRRERRDHCLPL